uniref:Capsid protein n=1 Tax=Betatorquevirus 004D TaxID=3163406 RepID=A0AAU7STV5_9VIRU
MPPYWNRYNYYQRRPYRRRRGYRFRRWRTGKTFRRRWHRRKWRRRNKVKRRFKKRKLKKLILKQFQPHKITKCKIIGKKCLFQGSPLRSSNNYIQYCYSYVPELYPGGGGWSLLVHSLGSLYEDYQHLHNVWTTSNAGMPLVRFLGVEFKFYQDLYTDYCVIYDNCWPLVDTPYTHANSCPSQMLQRKNKIIVPSKMTQNRKKPYKRCFVKPPTQMLNRWYFQRDICDTPLNMLTATAISLSKPFCDPKARSNNITVYCLNPHRFRNPNFQNPPITTGYSPFTADNLADHPKMYLYASHTLINKKKELQTLVPLCNTKDNKAGAMLSHLLKPSKDNNKFENWGNPFYRLNFWGEDNLIYQSKYGPTSTEVNDWVKTYSTSDENISSEVTLMVGYNLYACRYNPERDTGEGNMCYLLNNSSAASLEPPSNKNLIFEGFPLYILLWGWTDFIKKLKQTVDIDKNYFLVVKSPFFEEKLPYYIFIDDDFRDGFEPYTPHDKDNAQQYISPNNNSHWYPKYLFQTQSVEKICRSGPACTRPNNDNYLQAFYKYKFYFKWGGCPKQLAKAYDPCLQSKWPTPDNITPGLEISNPNEPPQTHIYDWDWEEDYVKEKALQRIRVYTESPKQILFLTDSKQNPKPLQIKEKKEESENEEETQLLLQLHNIRHQRKQLELLLQSKQGLINIP